MSFKNLMKIGGIIAVLLGTTPMIAVAQQSGRNYDNPPAMSVRVASDRSSYHRHYYRDSNRYYRHSHRYYGNSHRYYGNSHRYYGNSHRYYGHSHRYYGHNYRPGYQNKN